jgi:hypothetical protein
MEGRCLVFVETAGVGARPTFGFLRSCQVFENVLASPLMPSRERPSSALNARYRSRW